LWHSRPVGLEAIASAKQENDMPNNDRAAELEWRQQADEGGCADWGLAFAFPPRPEVPEPLTRAQAIVATLTALAVISLVLIAIFDRDIVSWPAL
jgi:hypothetical protein